MSSNGKTKIIKTEKRIVIRQKSPVKNNQTKFDQLYQNYITIRAKNELLRQRILQEREKKELSYCTFSPKLTKIRKIIFSKKHLKKGPDYYTIAFYKYYRENLNRLYSKEYSEMEIDVDDLNINNISMDFINNSFK